VRADLPRRPPLLVRACPPGCSRWFFAIMRHSVSPRGRAGHRPEHVHVPLHHPQGAQRLRQQSCVCRGRLKPAPRTRRIPRTQGLHDLAPILGVSNVQSHVNRAMTVSGLWGGGERGVQCVHLSCTPEPCYPCYFGRPLLRCCAGPAHRGGSAHPSAHPCVL